MFFLIWILRFLRRCVPLKKPQLSEIHLLLSSIFAKLASSTILCLKKGLG